MRNQLQRDVIDPRQSCRRPVSQLRQFMAVGARQMRPRRADLFLNQIIVVDKPLGGGGHPLPAFEGVGDLPIFIGKDCFIRRQARQKPVALAPPPRRRGQPVPPGNGPGMPCQLINAEQFRPQRPLSSAAVFNSMSRRRSPTKSTSQECWNHHAYSTHTKCTFCDGGGGSGGA